MSLASDFLFWVCWRRLRNRFRVPQFRASAMTYADKRCSFGRGARIYNGAALYNTTLGVGSYTWARMVNVRVGRYCSIGRARIGGHGRHPLSWISTHPAFYSAVPEAGFSLVTCDRFDGAPLDTVIGNDVWIGDGAVVMAGCKIGDGAVVGACAVVTKDVAPYAVVVGVPAKIIRYRFGPEVIAALVKWRWWNLEYETLKAMASAFTSRDDWTAEEIEALQQQCESRKSSSNE